VRARQRLTAAATGVATLAAAVCGGTAEASTPRAHCRVDPRPPLPAYADMSIAEARARSVRVVRRQARRPRSPLGRVLGDAAYRVEELGYISGDDPHRPVGGIVNIRFKERHPVDAIVPSWSRPWSRQSFNYRYSRRFGYTPYRVHFVARGVRDLWVDVDMRVRRIIEIAPGLDSGAERYEPLPGHCPIPPERPESR
jgi:hypothetical protein